MPRINVILDSGLSEVITSFRGPMVKYPIIISIDRNNGILRRWFVFSQGKRSVLSKYLFGKLLWDELNSFEQNVFWHLPEITKDRSIYLGLKALALGVSKRDLRKRMTKAIEFFDLKFITRQQYLTIKGRIDWFFLEETVSLRKSPKYSGYTKHYRDKGSLGSERDILSEVLEPFNDVSNEAILYFLTVGKLPLFGEGYVFPDDSKEG